MSKETKLFSSPTVCVALKMFCVWHDVMVQVFIQVVNHQGVLHLSEWIDIALR